MGSIWTDENRFAKWRTVELAVLHVRESLGQIPEGVTKGIANVTFIDTYIAESVNRRERVIGHDLNAFVEVIRCLMIDEATYPRPMRNPLSLADHPELVDQILAMGHPKKWDKYFHEGMTSYDTEEPAMALLFRQADAVIIEGMTRVMDALFALARKYRGTIMIGRTHGQWAQPVTFGKRCLDWFEMFKRALDRLHASAKEVNVMKLSGAVGFYGTLGPEIERAVADELDLTVAKIASQIVPLDRRAQHLNTLAEMASVVEKVARDLWLLSQSEIGEVREPFGKKQKGSSAMPHKKNPITFEKLFGLPRLIRAYAHAMLECVATAHERDISHSSVERIAVPDAYGLLDHMLQQLGRILEGLQVFPDRMAGNLEATCETYASQELASILTEHGVAAETAYRIVQQCAFDALDEGSDLSATFLERSMEGDIALDLKRKIVASERFKQIFDPKWWVRNEGVFYYRFGLCEGIEGDETLAR